MQCSIKEYPDFSYYLQDIHFIYRNGSAGGSKPILSHMKAVRTRLNAAMKTPLSLAFREPETRPVCSHLNRAVDNGLQGATSKTIRLFSRISSKLCWGFGYDKLPKHMESSYAYAEILGPHGPIICPDLVVGVVLLAPKSLYPAHSHKGITESYFCLSGYLSQNDAGVYVPGSMIFNPPEHQHRITTGNHEPCLLSYVWIGTQEDLATQKLSFSRKRR